MSKVEVDLFGRFVKVGYCFMDSEFDSIKPTILVDFDLVFVARIRARQLINLREDHFFIPPLLQFEERWVS